MGCQCIGVRTPKNSNLKIIIIMFKLKVHWLFKALWLLLSFFIIKHETVESCSIPRNATSVIRKIIESRSLNANATTLQVWLENQTADYGGEVKLPVSQKTMVVNMFIFLLIFQQSYYSFRTWTSDNFILLITFFFDIQVFQKLFNIFSMNYLIYNTFYMIFKCIIENVWNWCLNICPKMWVKPPHM